MKNEEQRDQSTNSPAEHFWEKPIGKITISVIAGVIVFFIGFAINRHFAPKPSPSEKTTEQTKKEIQAATHDTPEKITSEIKAVPPLQRDDVAKTFVGIPVDWELYFASGSPDTKNYNLLFRSNLDIGCVYIHCSIPKENNDHLRRLQENTKLRVQGKIERADYNSITLKDSKISQ